MSDVIEYYIWSREGLETVAAARAWTAGLAEGDGQQAPEALQEVWRGLGKRLQANGACWRGESQTGMAIQLLVSHDALEGVFKHTFDRRQAELRLYGLMPDLGVLSLPDGRLVDGTGRSWLPSRAPAPSPAPAPASERPVEPDEAVCARPKRVTREEMVRGLRPLMAACAWKEGRDNVWFTKKTPAGTWRLDNTNELGGDFCIALELTIPLPKALRDRTDSFHFPRLDFRYSLPKALRNEGALLTMRANGVLPRVMLYTKTFADVWRTSAELASQLRGVLAEVDALSTPEAVCKAALLEERGACPFDGLCGPNRPETISFTNNHPDLALLMRVDAARAERLFRERLALYRAQPAHENRFPRLANNLAELMRELGLNPDAP